MLISLSSGVLFPEITGNARGYGRFAGGGRPDYYNNCIDALSSAPVLNGHIGYNLPASYSLFVSMLSMLSDPSLFRRSIYRNWLWIVVSALHHMMWGVTALGAYETAHNGAIIGHFLTSTWWHNYLHGLMGGTDRVDIFGYSLERGSNGDLFGADFMFILPINRNDVKVIMFQAKRASPIGSIDVSQQHGSTGQRQLRVLVDTEDALFAAIGRAAGTGPSRFLSSACYYVTWHQTDSTGGIYCPTAQSARDISMSCCRSHRFRGLYGPLSLPSNCVAFNNGCDFGVLLGAYFVEPSSPVGLVINRNSLERVLSGLTFPPTTMFLVSGVHEADAIDWADALAARLGYRPQRVAPLQSGTVNFNGPQGRP